mgnify:CR=1 FL=1
MIGTSRWQWGHQCAKNVTIWGLPLAPPSVTGAPAKLFPMSFGAASPIAGSGAGCWKSGRAVPSTVTFLAISPPFALVVVGALYTLVPSGRPRRIAKPLTGLLVVVFAMSRVYLAVDHVTDVLLATAGACVGLWVYARRRDVIG